MPVSNPAPILLPIADVRDGKLLQNIAQVPVSLGPQDEMPMIRQERVRADPHGPGDERFLDDALERLEVGILQE
jgi:hypothetical protein